MRAAKLRQPALLLLSFFLFMLAAFALPSPAQAQGIREWSGVCVGTGEASDVATVQGFQCIVANLLSIAVSGLGLIGFVMTLVGGFTYMLSGGNSKGAETARQTITFAVAGLVVALSAFIILRLIANFTGVSTILNFTIPNSETQFK